MAILTTGAFLAEETLKGLLGLAVDGVKSLILIKKQARQKLVKVYLEILKNRNTLKLSGLLNTKGIDVNDKTFISAVKNLSYIQIEPLFAFNKKSLIFPNRKKEVQRRKTQYAINYIVTQITGLKSLISVRRNNNAPPVRLSYRLNTLDKHLETLEKTLQPIGKKRKDLQPSYIANC